MTVSIGTTLPGPIGTKTVAQAATDNGDTTFQDVLGDDIRHAGSKHAAPHPHRSRDNATHRMAADNKSDHDAPDGKDETVEETGGSRVRRFPSAPAREILADDDTTDATREKPVEATSGNPVHESLPLLMSLQEINRAAALAAGNDSGNDAGDQGKTTGFRRAAEHVLADVGSQGVDDESAKTGTARSIETQHATTKALMPTAGSLDQAAEPDTSANGDTGKPSPFGIAAEARRAGSTTTPGDHAARPSVQERVTIVSAQSFPAPAMPTLDPTTSRLVSAIASDVGSPHPSSSAVFAPGAAHQAPVAAHILKIELHPAELGVVNAHLRLTGEQLSIELLPDTQEAYHRLSSDSDTIARALRDLGFDVGKVTVLQPSIAAMPTARPDATSSTTAAPNRDSSSFQSGQSGGNGNAPGDHHSGRSRDNDAHNSGRSSSAARGRSGSGLFI
ncbi:hypothetical protein ASD64_05930 [Mesorhizobium sp. Root157]|uniref:flagellar hook-length control protein FliK n=1 Tax=Mesorhizobium sp. Root157 TaxID=1736477 RepID=UPI0006F7FE6D|nr:flagellar hook-length control protein FliK [Mesorhizobium sp. Root157]KQZ86998.1 hypothetical protein ASD64_05930 [Mesorhizobium sp. Root157]